MIFKNAYYLPSGRVFVLQTNNGYAVECTEMRDVLVGSKEHAIVRESTDPKVIWDHLDDYKKKWLLTVSTQKGCTHNCQFCDVAPLPFNGNLTTFDILDQVNFLLEATPYVTECDKVKIGFARMGEPAHNLQSVLRAIEFLPTLSAIRGRKFNWLPCFNSILPVTTMEGRHAYDVIDEVVKMKEDKYNGFLHFQISCNSTDEETRTRLFGGAHVLNIQNIINKINDLKITNRTVTLNFIVMKGIEVDVNKLMGFGLNPEKFAVKLIPLNATNNAAEHSLETYANYSNYDELVKLRDEFASHNIPVVMDAIAKCEEAGLCCGQIVGANKFNEGM